MSDSEFSSYILKIKRWLTITFYGLGAKKQAYLDLLAEEMVKNGFKRVESIEVKTTWGSFISKKSDLLFRSSDGLLWIGIRACPKDGDLRVGFADTYYKNARSFFILACSILLGTFFCFLSAYIIGQGSFDLSKMSPSIALIPVAIFFLVFLGVFTFFFGKPKRIWRRKTKAILVETADSMGGKKIIPLSGKRSNWKSSHG